MRGWSLSVGTPEQCKAWRKENPELNRELNAAWRKKHRAYCKAVDRWRMWHRPDIRAKREAKHALWHRIVELSGRGLKRRHIAAAVGIRPKAVYEILVRHRAGTLFWNEKEPERTVLRQRIKPAGRMWASVRGRVGRTRRARESRPRWEVK